MIGICLYVSWVFGWRRDIWHMRYVSFAVYSLFHRALLQRRPIILRRLLIVAFPYTYLMCFHVFSSKVSGAITVAHVSDFCMHMCILCVHMFARILLWGVWGYGVAMVSRIDKIISLFCRIASLLQGSFAKETCNFIDPTNQSHPIPMCVRTTYVNILHMLTYYRCRQ